jgi:hypothetical protein
METEGPWWNDCFGNSEIKGVIGKTDLNFGLKKWNRLPVESLVSWEGRAFYERK